MDNQSGFCAKCGKPLQSGQNFCASCGFQQNNFATNVVVPATQQNVSVMQQNTTLMQQPVTQKKSKKKLWVGLSVGVVAVLCLIVGVVVAVISSTRIKDRMIMVYMVGSDLESEAAAASLDINEMKDANFDQEHTKVLIYTGGTKKWALDEISPDENAIFEVVDGGINKVQVYDKKSIDFKYIRSGINPEME